MNGPYPNLLIAMLALGCAGCSKSNSTPGSAASSNSPLTAPIDYIGAQGRAKVHAGKVISTVQIEAAIRQFNAMEDRFPTGFDELVSQHYLQAMPEAPRGKRFVYNPQTGQIGLVPQ